MFHPNLQPKKINSCYLLFSSVFKFHFIKLKCITCKLFQLLGVFHCLCTYCTVLQQLYHNMYCIGSEHAISSPTPLAYTNYVSTPSLGLGDALFLLGSSVCPSQNHVHCVTWKTFKVSSWNFIQILTNIRWRAELKNHNSCIYTFWVMSLRSL